MSHSSKQHVESDTDSIRRAVQNVGSIRLDIEDPSPVIAGAARPATKESSNAGQVGVKVEEVAPKGRPPAPREDFDNKSYEPSTEEKHSPAGNRQSGKIGWALLWLLGIPLPVLLVIYLIRGH